jgi:hypothetical protein
MSTFAQHHLDDALILSGSGLIVYATWLLSWIAAIYVTGGILVVLGVLIGWGNRPSSRKDKQ